MSKNSVFYPLFFFSLTASAANVVDKELFERIINTFSLECIGEPAWPISLPEDNDPWLLGRLDALADAGLVHSAWMNNRRVWLLTPADTPSTPRTGDGCYGRMLLQQSPH